MSFCCGFCVGWMCVSLLCLLLVHPVVIIMGPVNRCIVCPVVSGSGAGGWGRHKRKSPGNLRVDTDTYQRHESEVVRNKWNSTYQSLNHRRVRLSFRHKPRKCWTSPLPLTQPYRNRRGGGLWSYFLNTPFYPSPPPHSRPSSPVPTSKQNNGVPRFPPPGSRPQR